MSDRISPASTNRQSKRSPQRIKVPESYIRLCAGANRNRSSITNSQNRQRPKSRTHLSTLQTAIPAALPSAHHSISSKKIHSRSINKSTHTEASAPTPFDIPKPSPKFGDWGQIGLMAFFRTFTLPRTHTFGTIVHCRDAMQPIVRLRYTLSILRRAECMQRPCCLMR